MPVRKIKNIMMQLLTNPADNIIKRPNNVILESYLNREHNIEKNYLPFVDFHKNKKVLNTRQSIFEHDTDEWNNVMVPTNDSITRIYVIGLSCFGLYVLNSMLKIK